MTSTTKNAPALGGHRGEGFDRSATPQEEGTTMTSVPTSTTQPPGWAIREALLEFDPHEDRECSWPQIRDRAHQIAAASGDEMVASGEIVEHDDTVRPATGWRLFDPIEQDFVSPIFNTYDEAQDWLAGLPRRRRQHPLRSTQARCHGHGPKRPERPEQPADDDLQPLRRRRHPPGPLAGSRATGRLDDVPAGSPGTPRRRPLTHERHRPRAGCSPGGGVPIRAHAWVMTDFDAARAFANAILDSASVATDDGFTVQALQLAVDGALETGAVQIDINDADEVDLDLGRVTKVV